MRNATIAFVLLALLIGSGCANSREWQRFRRAWLDSTQDHEVLHGYDLPGFTTIQQGENDLWIFAEGSPSEKAWKEDGELPDESVVRPGAGPLRYDLRAVDDHTIEGYLASQDGYIVQLRDDAIWVFRAGTESGQAFLKEDEIPENVVTVSGIREDGRDMKSDDLIAIVDYYETHF